MVQKFVKSTLRISCDIKNLHFHVHQSSMLSTCKEYEEKDNLFDVKESKCQLKVVQFASRIEYLEFE